MLTIEGLKEIAAHSVFASGTVNNSPEGVYMTDFRRDHPMKWFAKKGYIGDWCIYIGWAERSDSSILRTGDKVMGTDHIRRLVPCDSDCLKMYRY